MKIQTLIKSLLITNKKIAIPGLGSLVSIHKNAIINDKTGEITPPTKEIIFDESQKEDDGILLNTLQGYELSQEDSEKELDYLKNSILKKIDANEKYEIPDLGFFERNDKKEIIFKTTSKDFILPENVGLASLSFSKEELTPEKTSTKKIRKEKKRNKKTVEKNTTIKNSKTPKEEKKTKIKNKQKSKKITKTLLITLPIIAILILLGVFHKPIIKKGQDLWAQIKDTTKTEEIITDTDTTPDDVAKPNDNKPIDQFGNDEEYKKLLNSEITKTAEVDLGSNYKKFYIIVGSFSVEEYANKYKKELTNQGFDASVIKGNEYFRVSISGFNKADDLISTFNNMQNEYGDNLWVLINR